MDIVNDVVAKSSSVEEVSSINALEFRKNYFTKKRPVLLKGFAKDWGAKKKWDLDFLMNLEGDNQVLLLAANFIQDDNRYRQGSFKDYLQALKSAENNKEVMKDYLTTVDIFKFFPHLTEDIDFSLFEKNTVSNYVTGWIGPKGTISGFHFDTANNMYAQIMGKKMFIICPPKFNRNMYPSSKHIADAVASQIDLNNFDPKKFPKFEDAALQVAILEPGDVLFVPQKWWHYVKSLDTSISISNFGYTKSEKYTLLLKERIKHSLHKRGYYKPKNCFCCEA
ncbi:cupin-like domain-containing protein [Flagellimonas algicola]|uniref:Cupin-like domain-containing protein n=1 Tax=Flagellimonas algicola TaxID=2583815 RepID=A0ABY2WPF1_9FLAO|nr:cupin-like domain-containing protein [Allomuricauda algicola]TMU56868.1 cupin-like domain-containing protein [Allomuricauda algicola]